MNRRSVSLAGVMTALTLLLLAWPAAPALAQDDCVEGGNQWTRGAEIELSWSQRRDDPQTKQERYTKALEALEPSFAKQPVDPRTFLLAAQAHLGLRNFAQADSMLTALVEAVPACKEQADEMRFNAWVPFYNRGVEMLNAGDEAAALEAFEDANSIYRDARSLNNAASIHQSRGDTAKAIAMYTEALAAGGAEEANVRAATINLAELMRASGQVEEALQIYESYAADHPDDVLGKLNYAIALVDADQDSAAQEIFGELLGRDDLSFTQWSQVGIGLYRARNFTRAAQAFQKAHDQQPLNKETLENLANSHYQAENYAELLPLADTLVSLYPYERVNYNLLANARTEQKDEAGALAILEAREELAFEFLRAQLGQVGESVYSLDGQIMNRSGAEGSEVEIPVIFLGEGHTPVLEEMLVLTLPAQGDVAGFQLQVESDTPILGFRYEKAAPGGGA
ncbi:MAG: tetratricopeptide repeat protein [Gemmatimonadota bacterium]|nr:tetratricopeptide repeat protein [Gemmatimonadota bacterium]